MRSCYLCGRGHQVRHERDALGFYTGSKGSATLPSICEAQFRNLYGNMLCEASWCSMSRGRTLVRRLLKTLLKDGRKIGRGSGCLKGSPATKSSVVHQATAYIAEMSM